MGFSDLFSDVIASLGFAEAQAEAPPADDKEEDSSDDSQQEEKTESSDDGEQGDDSEQASEEGGEEGGEEEGGEEEEAEEEEEEPEDLKPKLEEGTCLLLQTLYISDFFHILGRQGNPQRQRNIPCLCRHPSARIIGVG
jgi:hypothetical protein